MGLLAEWHWIISQLVIGTVFSERHPFCELSWRCGRAKCRSLRSSNTSTTATFVRALPSGTMPAPSEDDAERAVRTGLELVAAVGALATHALQTRVGIATGLVVVGDLIGSGASQEQAIVGVTPNLAAAEILG